MRLVILALTTFLFLLITGCGQGIASPFNQIVPACQSDTVDLQTSSETSKANQSYQQYGQTRHERICSWDDSEVEPSVQVFKDALIAQDFIDGMIDGLSGRPGIAIPESRELMRRRYEKTLSEPGWVQYWTTSSNSSYDQKFGVHEIFFRLGRYVGSVSILPSEWDAAALNQLTPVMLEMVDELIKSLHQLNMEEGNQPSLSERSAIQKVIEHIRSGEPHQRKERVADWKEPPECEKLSDEAANAMAESIVADITKGTSQGSDKPPEVWNKWQATCIDKPSEIWENEGRPIVDRLWSEEVECLEWGDMKRESDRRLNLEDLSWEANYYDEIASRQNVDDLKEMLAPHDSSELGPDGLLNQHLDAMSKPGWFISQITFGGQSCLWILDEETGITWVMD